MASRHKRSASLPRSAATLALLVLAIPCVWSLDPAAALGRRRLEHNLGMATLARECFRLVESRGRLARQEVLDADETGSTVILRLRPSMSSFSHTW